MEAPIENWKADAAGNVKILQQTGRWFRIRQIRPVATPAAFGDSNAGRLIYIKSVRCHSPDDFNWGVVGRSGSARVETSRAPE
jgi:hypothetical protein